MLHVGRKPAVASDLLWEGKADLQAAVWGLPVFVFIVHINTRRSVDQVCGTFTVVIKLNLYCFNLSRAPTVFVQEMLSSAKETGGKN